MQRGKRKNRNENSHVFPRTFELTGLLLNFLCSILNGTFPEGLASELDLHGNIARY